MKDNYESLVVELIQSALVVDHSRSACDPSLIPRSNTQLLTTNYTVFIKMETARDTSTWLSIARCFKMWDLDARGSHHGLFRFWTHSGRAQVLVIGVPHSKYARLKPDNVTPLFLDSRAQSPRSRK